MHDQLAIQQVLNAYSEATSRADWDRVLSLFVPDAVWDVPIHGVKFEGIDAIREGLIRFSSPMEYIVQLNAPAVIQVNGDTATSRTAIRECGKYRDRNEGLEILLIYDDRLTRTPAGWKFALRVCDVQGMYTFPLEPA